MVTAKLIAVQGGAGLQQGKMPRLISEGNPGFSERETIRQIRDHRMPEKKSGFSERGKTDRAPQ